MEFSASNFHFDQAKSLLDPNASSFGTNQDIVKPNNSANIYLLKDLPPPAQVTGSTNLLSHFGLEGSYNKFCGKKLKETLSSFLPHLPGVVDGPASNGSSLRSVIDKPPIVGSKEIQPLSSGVLMSAFRLHTGALPDQYRPLQQQSENRRKHKHHKNKNRLDPVSLDQRGPELESKKHKKRKHEDGEKKKKKKEKKRKREREKERM